MYSVYVVELSRRVYTERVKFRAANPQYNGVLECLYVGMTSKTPKVRFEQHKRGHKTKTGRKVYSNIVRKYGMYLRPTLYAHIKPMKTRAEAVEMEKQLALELRGKRYAVWYG